MNAVTLTACFEWNYEIRDVKEILRSVGSVTRKMKILGRSCCNGLPDLCKWRSDFNDQL